MEKLSYAFNLIKKNLTVLILIPLAYVAMEALVTKHVMFSLSTNDPMSVFLGNFFGVGLPLVFLMIARITFLTGYIPMLLDTVAGKKVEFIDFRNNLEYSKLLRVFLIQVIILVIAMIGGLLLILPGLVWVLLNAFTIFIVLESKLGLIDSIGESIKLTKNFIPVILGYYALYFFGSFLFSFINMYLVILYDMIATPLLYVILILIYSEAKEKKLKDNK
jgi:hypothetical protein